MSSVCSSLIAYPQAWTVREVGGVEGLSQSIPSEVISGVRRIIERTRHKAPQSVTQQEFDDPVVNAWIKTLHDEILHGRGALLVRGLDAGGFDEEQLERFFWGIGTHMGHAPIQSNLGDRLGHVLDDPNNTKDRGYRSRRELVPHTDPYEIVGLLSLQRAETGGESQLVNSLAIHNAFLTRRPDLLPALYEGYYYAMNEARDSAEPVTPYKIPVFSCVDGKVSCYYHHPFMREAARRLGQEMSPQLKEALEMMDRLADSPELKLEFTIQPTEFVLINNFTILHSRSEFTNSETRQRHLLRLWLDVPGGRPVRRELKEFARSFEKFAPPPEPQPAVETERV